MAERRPLTHGIKSTPPVDSAVAQEFIYEGHQAARQPDASRPPAHVPAPAPARTPISTRIRADLAQALKRASLERQLDGRQPNTLQGILEHAVEPWLKDHGYLP